MTLDALLQERSVTRAAARLGLSVPAVSHALARLRERFDDELLVRTGRSMSLTPRAEALRERVRTLVEDGNRLLERETSFDPARIRRTFTVHATDHVLLVLGPILAEVLRTRAPGVNLSFLSSGTEDWLRLREGTSDLSVCLPGHFPGEFLTRALFEDRFVCAVSRSHPRVGKRLALADYLALEHVVVSPLGTPSAVDAILAKRGLSRTIRATVPYFLTGLHLLTHTDAILTVSERAARALEKPFDLKLLPPPLELPTYSLNLLWHPRVDRDPENVWLREQFVEAARRTEPRVRKLKSVQH